MLRAVLWWEVPAALGCCSPRLLFRLLLGFAVFSLKSHEKLMRVRNAQARDAVALAVAVNAAVSSAQSPCVFPKVKVMTNYFCFMC